jgi:CheY-like chemotaxis protein
MAHKILVVEDDAFLRSAYTSKLGTGDFVLKIAKDGVEALEVLKTYKPDVIILDLIMPRKDGFATLEEIKKDESLRDIPVIAASNLAQTEDVERVKSLGAVEFFTKSDHSLKELVDLINKTLSK